MITKQEKTLARTFKGPSQMERVRAARAIIDAHRGNAEGLALSGFMAIFHPEFSEELTRDMVRDFRRREGR